MGNYPSWERGMRAVWGANTAVQQIFTVHLEVFGIISGVVIVIVLYSRSFWQPVIIKMIILWKEQARLCCFDEEVTATSLAVLPALKDYIIWRSCTASSTNHLRGNISISLDLLRLCGEHIAVLLQRGTGSWLRWSATADPRANLRRTNLTSRHHGTVIKC